jgi:hypothetical protein
VPSSRSVRLAIAVNGERRMRLWSLVVQQARGRSVAAEDACNAAIMATGVDSGAVTVIVNGARETVYASDGASELEELALVLGEGPCVDAYASGPVLVADLTASECLTRWPGFAPAAAEAGCRAVFALPLQVGGINLGVLDLYRAQAGELDRERVADALGLADTVCALLLDGAHGDDLGNRQPEQTRLQHPEVHQATGMIIVQLGVTAAVALIRLRAYAYAHDRRLHEVARDVVARRLHFGPEEDGAR